jgi:hypothetical protein
MEIKSAAILVSPSLHASLQRFSVNEPLIAVQTNSVNHKQGGNR